MYWNFKEIIYIVEYTIWIWTIHINWNKHDVWPYMHKIIFFGNAWKNKLHVWTDLSHQNVQCTYQKYATQRGNEWTTFWYFQVHQLLWLKLKLYSLLWPNHNPRELSHIHPVLCKPVPDWSTELWYLWRRLEPKNTIFRHVSNIHTYEHCLTFCGTKGSVSKKVNFMGCPFLDSQ